MGDVSIVGSFSPVTIGNIVNSVNTAESYNADSKIKDALKELAIEVAKLAKELPPKDAEAVAKDLSSLTSEATSSCPREENLKLSFKGILGAAKYVAELLPVIKTSVTIVAGLLGFSLPSV